MRSLLIVILVFILAACTSTKYVEVPVPVETVRTEYINQLYKDSVFIHDSIDRYISGDTVYQYKYKYIYKYKNRVDTLVQNDTIQVPVTIRTTETVEVNKIKWYQSILMHLGFGLIVVLGYKGIKFLWETFTKVRDKLKL